MTEADLMELMLCLFIPCLCIKLSKVNWLCEFLWWINDMQDVFINFLTQPGRNAQLIHDADLISEIVPYIYLALTKLIPLAYIVAGPV